MRITTLDGTRALLLDGPGRGVSGFGFGRDDVMARLGDAGLAPAEDRCGVISTAIEGVLKPTAALAPFVGAADNGN